MLSKENEFMCNCPSVCPSVCLDICMLGLNIHVCVQATHLCFYTAQTD